MSPILRDGEVDIYQADIEQPRKASMMVYRDDGEVEIYQADIEQPRTASLMVYEGTFAWLTIADGDGAETTILINLNDEGDTDEDESKFAAMPPKPCHVVRPVAESDAVGCESGLDAYSR